MNSVILKAFRTTLKDNHGCRFDVAIVVLIALAGVIAYWNSFDSPFLFDGNPLIQHLRRLKWNEPGDWIKLRTRFIGYLTFDLNYTFHGELVTGYHAVNIAIHAFASACLYLLARRHAPRRVATVAALVFLLHPMQTQSVTYIYQRFEALMGLFLLAGLLSLSHAEIGRRRVAWLIAAYLCFVLSVGSKEVGVVAPLLYLWFDRVFMASTWQELWNRRGPFHVVMFASLGVAGVAVYALRDHYASGGLLCPDRVTAVEYALTQPGVIVHYVRQFIIPYDLCVDEAWPVETRLAQKMLSSAGILFTLGTLTWVSLRYPRLGFLLGAPLLVLAPTSSVAPIVDISFTHRTYTSVAAVSMLFALSLDWLSCLTPKRWRPWGFATLATIICLALGLATAWRNTVYADPIRFWSDIVSKAPHNIRGLSNLGLALNAAGRHREATRCYERATTLWFDSQQSDPSSMGDRVRRIPGRHTAIVNPLLQLGVAAMNKGDLIMATRLFDELIHLPRLPTTNEEPQKIFYNYAILLIKRGRLDEAEVVLKQTITAHPSYASAQHELALLLASRGRHDEAIVTLGKALSLELPSARRGKYAFNLASIHSEIGDLQSAERHLIDACKADPTETSYTGALTAVRRRLSDIAMPDERPPIVTSDSRDTP